MTTATATIDNTLKSLHVSTTGSFGQLETSKVVPKITPDDIIADAKLEEWQAFMYPNMNEDNTPVDALKSNYIRQEFLKEEAVGINPVYLTDEHIDHHGRNFALKVPSSYRIIQYPQGLRWLENYTDESLIEIQDWLLLDSGAILAVNNLIPDEVLTIQGEADKITPYMIFTLSHDGTTPRAVFFSSFRAICKNTLMMALASAKGTEKFFGFDPKKGSHKSPQELMTMAKRNIDLAKTKFHDETAPHLEALRDLQLDTKVVDTLTRDLFAIRRTQEIPAVLDEDESYPSSVKNYHKFMDIYRSLADVDIFDASQHTGYRFANAATSFVKTTGKDSGFDPLSGFKGNMFGKVRKNAFDYLDELLPAKHIGA
jgi:hypothetical protein